MYRILVVDDEPSILHSLALLLLSNEYSVDIAATGNAAVEKGSQEKYDVLIVDLSLPDMHGFEVIGKLREQNPEIIPIIISAHCLGESAAEAREWGVYSYFEKPFPVQSLKEAISQGIAERDVRSVPF
jgi:DNA-binding response OmpR family regulator